MLNDPLTTTKLSNGVTPATSTGLHPTGPLSDERQLPVAGQSRDADADEAQRARAVAQAAVEERAGELPDARRVVGADLERGRAAADREVGVAELRRHGPGRLS